MACTARFLLVPFLMSVLGRTASQNSTASKRSFEQVSGHDLPHNSTASRKSFEQLALRSDTDPVISFVQPENVASASLQDDFPTRQLASNGLNGFNGLNAAPFGYSSANLVSSPYSLSSSAYDKPNCLGTPAGMYGSPTYNCQVYYVCQIDGRLDAMPCALGTKFNNLLGVCDWPQKIDSNCNPLYVDPYDRVGAPYPPLQQYQSAALRLQEPQYQSAALRLQEPYGSSRLYQAPRYSPAYRRF